MKKFKPCNTPHHFPTTQSGVSCSPADGMLSNPEIRIFIDADRLMILS